MPKAFVVRTPQRELLVKTLLSQPGYKVSDHKSGRATSKLHELMGTKAGMAGMPKFLNDAVRHGLITVKKNARRTHEIALNLPLPENFLDLLGFEVEEVVPVNNTVRLPVERKVFYTEEEKLKALLDEARAKVATVISDNNRLKARLQEAEDMLRAKNTEIRGLNNKVNSLERQVERLSQDTALEISRGIRHGLDRELSKLMSARPEKARS